MSFTLLFCALPNGKAVNVYFNGRPIGLIEGLEATPTFTAHHFTGADGTKKAIRMEDLAKPCPFETCEALKATMGAAIASLAIENTPHAVPEDGYAESRRLTEEAKTALDRGDIAAAQKLLAEALRPNTVTP